MAMAEPEIESSETSSSAEECSGNSDSCIVTENSTETTNESTASEPEPEPEPPKEPTAKDPEKPEGVELKATGAFLAGTATMKIDEKSRVSCNKVQVMKFIQNGRIFTYTRTDIGVDKKED